MLGMWEILAIGGIVVLLFGARKLPALGGAVGESIKNFKRGIQDIKTIDAESKEDQKGGAGDNQTASKADTSGHSKES